MVKYKLKPLKMLLLLFSRSKSPVACLFYRLKALVAIPKVQPRFAVAVWKKYPTMKSLLKVYMDPNKSEQEKELLLKDLKLEGLTGKDTNLGIVGSKRIYRVLMSRTGELKTDEVASQIYSPHDLD